MSGFMDRERLAELRADSMFGGQQFTAQNVRDLLADRYAWRNRCPVTSKDVANFTGEQLCAWLLAAGWHEVEWEREHFRLFGMPDTLDQFQVGIGPADTWIDAPRCKAETVRRLAAWRGLSQFEVLDEIAAMDGTTQTPSG